MALEIDFFKCVLKIVIALCWLIYLSRSLEIRLNYMMLKSQSLCCLYHISYHYLSANESKVTQLEMLDESKRYNLKSTILKDTKIDMMVIMHVRNGMSYLKLLLVPK